MTYDDAEQAGRDRQDTDGNPTLAQWARAEALKAIMSSPTRNPLGGMEAIADQVHTLAELIVEGGLPQPQPQPGTFDS